jgi:hypothetical protein
MLTYSIQDSLHDLELHVDENGRVILDAIYKDFAAMRVYLTQLRRKIEGKDVVKRGKRGA